MNFPVIARQWPSAQIGILIISFCHYLLFMKQKNHIYVIFLGGNIKAKTYVTNSMSDAGHSLYHGIIQIN